MDDKEISDSINRVGRQLMRAYNLVSDDINSHAVEPIPEDKIIIHYAIHVTLDLLQKLDPFNEFGNAGKHTEVGIK